MFKKDRIQKRLTKSFIVVAVVTAIAAVVGLCVLMYVAKEYSNALHNYGFAQGDIGKAMFELADTRSAMRGVIGYESMDTINDLLEEHDKNKALFEENFAVVEETIVSEDGRVTYDAIKAELDDYWKLESQILELGATEDEELSRQAQELALGDLRTAYSSIYTKLESLLEVKVTEGNKLAAQLQTVSYVMMGLIVGVIILSIIIATQIGKSIAKGIASPLGELSVRLQTFAQGDLSSPFPTMDTDDEVAEIVSESAGMAEKLNAIINDMGEVLGDMAGGNYAVESSIANQYTGEFEKLISSMEMMRDKMTTTLHSIEEASGQVSAGASNMAEASQSLAEGATEQAGAVEELQATITNIGETMEKSAQSSEESYNHAQKCADEADKSRTEMNALMDAMERINETSKKIENIISEIESIASQTNLLSLNASIEAARAGEAGRGFAVVADQIRQLADQSNKSAGNTRELIEGALQEIADGSRAAERASNSIAIVVDGIKEVAEASRSLSTMASDQAETMRQAEMGVNQISEVVQNNSATAQESSATSQQLSAQAVTLDELIGQFVLKR